jgi:hypothetical protein
MFPSTLHLERWCLSTTSTATVYNCCSYNPGLKVRSRLLSQTQFAAFCNPPLVPLCLFKHSLSPTELSLTGLFLLQCTSNPSPACCLLLVRPCALQSGTHYTSGISESARYPTQYPCHPSSAYAHDRQSVAPPVIVSTPCDSWYDYGGAIAHHFVCRPASLPRR